MFLKTIVIKHNFNLMPKTVVTNHNHSFNFKFKIIVDDYDINFLNKFKIVVYMSNLVD